MTGQAKKIPGWVKPALEYGPVIAFFIGYLRLKDQVFTIGGSDYSGFLVVTAAFIPLMILSTGLMWWITGRLSLMQVVTLVLVVVFGGLSLWLQDERFFKMKPTIIYLFFAGALGVGLLRGQSWLRLVLGEALPMSDRGWLILTRRMALFFLGLAVANEVVWRLLSTDTWVSFKTFGLPVAMFAFFIAQAGLLKTHSLPADVPPDEPPR